MNRDVYTDQTGTFPLVDINIYRIWQRYCNVSTYVYGLFCNPLSK